MERRTTTKPVRTPEFLCLCIALGDEDRSDLAWEELNRISGRDAEEILLDLDSLQDEFAEPVLEAAQLFLKDRAWKRTA